MNNLAQYNRYLNDPFDPHAIAGLRQVAYRKAIVMSYIDNLIDWGDMLFRRYTRETINEARMLYVLAYDLLGKKPELVGTRKVSDAQTYKQLRQERDAMSAAGIRDQVEVSDVCTLMTWERYMGGSQVWFDFPNRKLDFTMREDLSDKEFKTTLPGLSNFYFVGIWATAMGSLAHNASWGQTIIRRICKKDGKRFKIQP